MTNIKKNNRAAVLLINLGTPDAPEAPEIRRYLAEFLSDRRVVNIPRLIWLPILYLLILTFRPARLVPRYKLIWGTHDGPIRNITRALASRVERLLSRMHQEHSISVEAAMTYGQPSIERVIADLKEKGISKFLFFPLYPQYSNATTAAARDQVERVLSIRSFSSLGFIPDYHRQPVYIHALIKSIQTHSEYLKSGARLVFSFHGIPQAQASKGDPYPAQCLKTARLVAEGLQLAEDGWLMSFQSRFGPADWLKPYTSDVMARLPKEGTDKVLVICPGFATDCLETIEEIKIVNRRLFLEAGGRSFRYVKALNATSNHAKMVADIIDKYIAQDAN